MEGRQKEMKEGWGLQLLPNGCKEIPSSSWEIGKCFPWMWQWPQRPGMMLGGLIAFWSHFSATQNSGLHHSFLFCLRVTKNSDCLPGKFTVLGIWGLFESGGLVGCFNVRLSYAFPFLCEEKKLTFLWRALHNHPVGLHSHWIHPSSFH